uniref:Uncharacterized protein n=1 Tax=Aegilops tauschii TaxID=37682 RepID=M8D2K2_AEGTA
MPALTAKRASSERCAIRRELHRRRKLAAAPKGGIISKDASIQSKPSSLHAHARGGVAMPSASTLHAPALVAACAPTATGEVTKRRCTTPPRRPAPAPSRAATRETSTQDTTPRAEHVKKKMPSSSIRVKKGMTVKVRTRAGILPTGHCPLLWLAARVVSDAADDDGYIEVIYNGNFPCDDPFRTVRVAMDDVRSMPAIVESS